MPQGSVAYAAARIYGRAQKGLSAARAERLISAQTLEEACRALVEFGLLNADNAGDAQAAAEERLREASAFVRRITPDAKATDCFFLRYDGMNLKMLIKARILGRVAQNLSHCGTIDVSLLRHAVAGRKYGALPPILANALEKLEKELAIAPDPLLIDQTVDQAVYALIAENLQAVQSPLIRQYFQARVDMLNAIMVLRARHLGKEEPFIQKLLLPGGAIGREAWAPACKAPGKIAAMLSGYGAKVRGAAALSAQEAGNLPLLEKAMEDALLKPFRALKESVYRIEPVIGYWLGAEREAAAIRLILMGHANGFDAQTIRERVGELYAG